MANRPFAPMNARAEVRKSLGRSAAADDEAPLPLYLSIASRREAGEVEDASQPEPPQGQ